MSSSPAFLLLLLILLILQSNSLTPPEPLKPHGLGLGLVVGDVVVAAAAVAGSEAAVATVSEHVVPSPGHIARGAA